MEIRKYFKLNDNKIQKLWNAASKTYGMCALGSCIVLNTHFRQEQRLKIDLISIHLKKLEKKSPKTPKENRRKGIIWIR